MAKKTHVYVEPIPRGIAAKMCFDTYDNSSVWSEREDRDKQIQKRLTGVKTKKK